MNIVLAGGTGMIGADLSRRLTSAGHAVVILTRDPQPSVSFPGMEFQQWDARRQGAWAERINSADVVINLSGESVGTRWTGKRKERILGSRVETTNAIVEAIRNSRNKPGVLVNASAVGYYGHVEEGDVLESNPAGSDFLARTCTQWEAAALRGIQHGIRVVVLRTGFVISRTAEAFRRMQLPFSLFAGGPFGSGDQWFPWIHLDDVVGGYLFAMENKALSGPVNLTSPSPVRVRDFTRALGKAMHRPSFVPVPAFALKIILGEMSDLLLKGQKVIPKKLTEAGYQFRFPGLEDALRDVAG